MMSHCNQKKMRRHSKRKNGKTQRGGMKPILTINLHEMYDNDRIVALFRDDREGRDMSEFFRKTQKIIQMPNGLEAKLYKNGQLCFNSKRVVRCPDWMMVTFKLNEIDPSPPPSDCMKTILSMIQTDDNNYEMSRDDLLCMRDAFPPKSNLESLEQSLKPSIDKFVVAFIKTYKTYVEITALVVHAAKQEQMARAEESSLSFLDSFDDMIHAIKSPFISERRKSELIQLKANVLTAAHRGGDMTGFKAAMIDFIQKLIVINHMMKYCLIDDQAEFDACKIDAAKKVITHMPHDDSPSVLTHLAKQYVNELQEHLIKSQSPQPQSPQPQSPQPQSPQPQSPQPHLPSKPLPPTPNPTSTTDWSNVTSADWSGVPVSTSTFGWGGRKIMQHKKSIRRCKGRNSHKLTKSK
jgi:hypothetical protein